MSGKTTEKYDLLSGLVRVTIASSKSGRVTYHIQEKSPEETYSAMMRDVMSRYLQSDGSQTTIENIISGLEQPKGVNLDTLRYFLSRFETGLLQIEPLMHDPRIEDISCISAELPVYVFLREYGYVPTNVSFPDEENLNSFIRRLAQSGGKQVSASSPIVESTLPDGSRFQASIGRFVTTRGPSFSIRRFRETPLSPLDLIALDTVTPDIMGYLWTIIENGANIMIVGGTASGKTTFLNAILSFIPADRKIVTIEDTRELNLPHQNWIATVTRGVPGMESGTSSGGNEISMFDLLESSLRHRPNYIVLGEVRGPETFTVFQAMSAGRFGLGTFHADDVATFIHRLESRPIGIPRNLLGSLDAIVILKTAVREGRLVRYVSEISEVVGLDPENHDLITNSIFKRTGKSYESSGYSYAIRRICTREGLSEDSLSEEMRTRAETLKKMADLGMTEFSETFGFFSLFSRDREKALKILGS